MRDDVLSTTPLPMNSRNKLQLDRIFGIETQNDLILLFTAAGSEEIYSIHICGINRVASEKDRLLSVPPVYTILPYTPYILPIRLDSIDINERNFPGSIYLYVADHIPYSVTKIKK